MAKLEHQIVTKHFQCDIRTEADDKCAGKTGTVLYTSEAPRNQARITFENGIVELQTMRLLIQSLFCAVILGSLVNGS